MISYRLPDQIHRSIIDGRPVLSTPQGGKIAVDSTLLSLWEYAPGRSLDEALEGFQAEYATQQTVRSALACLCQAGLLEREGASLPTELPPEPVNGPLVSAVIVGYNRFSSK